MSMRLQKLKKDMTPRQRCAIVYPIADSGALPHARHHRRNGNVQSILTLDVAEIGKLKGATKDILARSLDGWYGIWHARVSMHPVTHLDEWDEITIGQAKLAMMRCVGGVGIEDGVEVHNGADLQSIHVYKWATLDELKLSLEELLGKSFADLKASE